MGTKMIMLGEYSKFLFVHIPKNAGTSVTEFLTKNKLDSWRRNIRNLHHDSFMSLCSFNPGQIGQECFKFAICRNPYTRTFSYYKHFNRINNLNVSFQEFLEIIFHKKFFERTPMISYDQSYYTYNFDPNLQLDKIYRFENLQELEKDFNFTLSRKNFGKWSKDEYHELYVESKMIDVVKYVYYRDFKIFNYSLDFNDSLKYLNE